MLLPYFKNYFSVDLVLINKLHDSKHISQTILDIPEYFKDHLW